MVDKKDTDSDETTKAVDLSDQQDSSDSPVETIQNESETEQSDASVNDVASESGEDNDGGNQDDKSEDTSIAESLVTNEPKQTKSGGFVPAFLGGVVAAVLGFIAATSGVLDDFLPPSWRQADPAEQIAKLEHQIADQAENLTSLSGRVSGLKTPDLSPLEDQVAGMSANVDKAVAAVANLQSDLDDLDKRLVALEKRPVTEGISQSAIDAYERELARLQEALTTQRAEVEAMIAQARAMDASAAEAARQAGIQAMVAMLLGALDDGSAFSAVVEELKASGVAVPDALTDPAATGVATLAALQAEFPAVARDALAAARQADSGDQTGIGGFLKRQLGARSVEPREGNDPDAVLSRAEANLKNGDLGSALDELSVLPEAATKTMQGWISAAAQRHAAMDAATAIAADPAMN